MSVREVTYYEVACDEPECKAVTGDDGEYSAWGSHGAAVDEWVNCDGIVLNDGRAFCYRHANAKCCAGCDYEGDALAEVDGEHYCAECVNAGVPS